MASNVFKMQLYGDVLMVQQSREHCWVPRERFVSYTRQEFCDQYLKKRKRGVGDVHHLTPNDYDKVKKEMQDVFNSYEARMAVGAVKPSEMSKVMKMPQKSGGDLGRVAREVEGEGKVKKSAKPKRKPPEIESDPLWPGTEDGAAPKALKLAKAAAM